MRPAAFLARQIRTSVLDEQQRAWRALQRAADLHDAEYRLWYARLHAAPAGAVVADPDPAVSQAYGRAVDALTRADDALTAAQTAALRAAGLKSALACPPCC